MEIKEKKEITIIKYITTSIKCDVCGISHYGNDLPKYWHNISISHNEWGNDSIDSIEDFDVCSKECYIIKFKDCVKNYEDRYNAQIDGFSLQFARLLLKLKTE